MCPARSACAVEAGPVEVRHCSVCGRPVSVPASPPPVESILIRILSDGDCHSASRVRQLGGISGEFMRARFGLTVPDGRLVPMVPARVPRG